MFPIRLIGYGFDRLLPDLLLRLWRLRQGLLARIRAKEAQCRAQRLEQVRVLVVIPPR